MCSNLEVKMKLYGMRQISHISLLNAQEPIGAPIFCKKNQNNKII